MKWFRLYNDVRHDPKVQNLSPELFRFWINLLCLASSQPERGTIPDTATIVTDLGMRRDHVERFIGLLVASKLLIRGDKGAYYPHSWDVRQPKSDDVARRVNGFRQRSSEKVTPVRSETVDPRSNVSCTVLEGDTDSDTENARKHSPPPPTPTNPFGDGETIPAPRTPVELANDPAEVERLATKADAAFPGKHFGERVRAYARHWPTDWLSEALAAAFREQARDWRFVVGALRRTDNQGGLGRRQDRRPADPGPPNPPPYQVVRRSKYDYQLGLVGTEPGAKVG